MPSSRGQVIMAPARPAIRANLLESIFLAGTTSPTGEPDWRLSLTETLLQYPVAIFNPQRNDWDSTWSEDSSDSRWAEQVEWELDMQDAADIIVVFFHGATQAPVSLLELGLCVRSGRAIVCALEGYAKRGNVEAVCRRYGAEFVGTAGELTEAVVRRLKREMVVFESGEEQE